MLLLSWGALKDIFSPFLPHVLLSFILVFSFTHVTSLRCYLKLPLSVGGKDVGVWIFCCIPLSFPPSLTTLSSFLHPPSVPQPVPPYLLPPFILPLSFPSNLLSLLWAWPFVVSSQGATDYISVCVSSSWILRDLRDLGGGAMETRISCCWFGWQRWRLRQLCAVLLFLLLLLFLDWE